MTLRVRLVAPSGEVVAEFAVAKFPARLGRDPAGEVPIDETKFPMVSWLHAELDVTSVGPIVTPKSQKNRTLLNDTPLDAPAQVRAGDRVRLGLSGPTIQVVAVEAPAPKPPVTPPAVPTLVPPAPPPLPKDWGSTVAADVNDLAALRRTVDTKLRVTVGDGGILGRDRESKFHLPHPLVSRQHAAVRDRDGILVLKDLGSANGTYLNGKRLTRPAELKPGDLIDVGPFSLSTTGRHWPGRRGRTTSNWSPGTSAGWSRTGRPAGRSPSCTTSTWWFGRGNSSACSGRAGREEHAAQRPERPGRPERRERSWSTVRTCTPTSTPSSGTSPSSRSATFCTSRWRSAWPSSTRPSSGCRPTPAGPRSTRRFTKCSGWSASRNGGRPSFAT